ncbi:tape measure protein [Labrys sp. 22185]|uniref:tape measure protein n=1 Tax=Labrys sp. 22185 TaxID=3453888 RepID=UPI003F876C99
MADDTERLSILLEARVNQLEKDMARANRITTNSFAQMRKASKQAADNMAKDFEGAGSKIGNALSGLGKGGIGDLFSGGIGKAIPGLSGVTVGFAAAGAAVVAAAGKAVAAGDTWNQLGNRLKTAGVAAGDLAFEQNRIADMALASHSSLESVADVYSKMLGVSKEFGKSNEDAAKATEAVAKALSLAGVDAGTANGAIRQLGQALGSGVLRGDEFNSLMEALGTSSPLIKSIAREFGIATSQLRAFAAEGGLTSDRVFKALVAAKPEVDRLARDSIPSLAQAWQNLDTATTRAAATIAQGSSAAGFLARSFDGLAQAISDAATAYDRWQSKTNPKQGDLLGSISAAAQQMAQAQSDLDAAVRQGYSIDDPRLAHLRDKLALWKSIASALEQAAAAQSTVNEQERIAAQQQRERDKTEPSAADKKVLSDRDKAAGIGMNDREQKIAAATDKIIEALKKSGSKLSDAAMQDLARTQATREYDAGVSSEGVASILKSYTDRVIRAESGGKANAANPNSSAVGFGQFIASTWVDQFKKVFPQQAETMSREGILALRSDMGINRALIENYAKENADALQKAGVAVNEAALHLSHFLGVGDAIKVLKAAPGTPLAGLISGASIRANPTILGGGRTTDDAIAYANKRANNARVAAGDLNPAERRAKTIKDLIDASKQDTAEIERNTSTLGRNSYAQAYSAKQAELLNQAKREGVEITPQLRAAIDQEAAAYARATTAQESQKKSLQQTAEMKDWLGGELTSVFSGIVTGSMSASQALQRLAAAFAEAAIQAALLGKGPFGGMFGGGGGILGALFSGFGGGGAVSVGTAGLYADGGMISGPGGPRDDRIMAMVSNGEFVVNAAATKKYGALLEAINSGQIPRFAAGGFIGPRRAGGAGLVGAAGPAITYSPVINVNAQGGTKEQNQDAADRTAKAIEQQIRAIVGQEIIQQMRPGNAIYHAARGRR